MNLENAKFTVRQVVAIVSIAIGGAGFYFGVSTTQKENREAIATIQQAIASESQLRQQEQQRESQLRQQEQIRLQDRLEKTIEFESKSKKEDIERLVKSVDGVKESIEKMTVVFVTRRDMEQFIHMLHELNKDKHPDFKVPQLPK